MVNTLSHWQTKITTKEHEKNRAWTDFKTFSKKHGPSISAAQTAFKYSHALPPHVDKGHLQELIQETKESIMQGVSRVDI